MVNVFHGTQPIPCFVDYANQALRDACNPQRYSTMPDGRIVGLSVRTREVTPQVVQRFISALNRLADSGLLESVRFAFTCPAFIDCRPCSSLQDHLDGMARLQREQPDGHVFIAYVVTTAAPAQLDAIAGEAQLAYDDSDPGRASQVW